MKKLKFVVVGPSKSGKTALTNILTNRFLSKDNNEQEENKNEDTYYDPTIGCRIVKYEQEDLNIEFWDIGGDHNFECCWPAVIYSSNSSIDHETNIKRKNNMKSKPDAVLILLHQESNNQIAPILEELDIWYDYFVKGVGISNDRCMLLVRTNHVDDASRNDERNHAINKSKLPSKFDGCTLSYFDLCNEDDEYRLLKMKLHKFAKLIMSIDE